jgi:hypothetical protein
MALLRDGLLFPCDSRFTLKSSSLIRPIRDGATVRVPATGRRDTKTGLAGDRVSADPGGSPRPLHQGRPSRSNR